MAQWVTAGTTLPEDLHSIPSAHIHGLQLCVTPDPSDPMPLMSAGICTHVHICCPPNTPLLHIIHKIQSSKRYLKSLGEEVVPLDMEYATPPLPLSPPFSALTLCWNSAL